MASLWRIPCSYVACCHRASWSALVALPVGRCPLKPSAVHLGAPLLSTAFFASSFAMAWGMSVSESEVPEELRDVFMYLAPQPEQAPPSQGSHPPGSKRRRAQQEQHGRDGDDLRHLCQQMTRLLLRHEDSLNVLCLRPQLGGVHGLPSTWHPTTTDGIHYGLAHTPQEGRSSTTPPCPAERDHVPGDVRSPPSSVTLEGRRPDLARCGAESRKNWWYVPPVNPQTKRLEPSANPGKSIHELLPIVEQLIALSKKDGDRLHAMQNTNKETTKVIPWRVTSEHPVGFDNDEPSGPASEQRSLADHLMPQPPLESTEIQPGTATATQYAGGLPRSAIQSAILGAPHVNRIVVSLQPISLNR